MLLTGVVSASNVGPPSYVATNVTLSPSGGDESRCGIDNSCPLTAAVVVLAGLMAGVVLYCGWRYHKRGGHQFFNFAETQDDFGDNELHHAA